MMTMDSQDPEVHRLYEVSLNLAKQLSEQFMALEHRDATQLEEEARRGVGEASENLRQARDLCQQALEGPLTGDAHAVLAHRLLQLAIGPNS